MQSEAANEAVSAISEQVSAVEPQEALEALKKLQSTTEEVLDFGEDVDAASSDSEQSHVDLGSSSSSSDSDSSSDSEEEGSSPATLGKSVAYDDEEDGETGTVELRTKNELPLPQVSLDDIVIPENSVIERIGAIHGIVERFVVVESSNTSTAKVIDTDTVLVLSDKTILGRVFDVFGPVTKPLFSVLFNSDEEIKDKGFKVGDEIYYIPDLAKFVNPYAIKTKGTDASNLYDEEVAEPEFSDDEAEEEYKRQKRAAKNGEISEEGELVDTKPKRARQQRGPRNSQGHNQRGPHSNYQINNRNSAFAGSNGIRPPPMGMPFQMYPGCPPPPQMYGNLYMMPQMAMPYAAHPPRPHPTPQPHHQQQQNFYKEAQEQYMQYMAAQYYNQQQQQQQRQG